jgi:beta-glucosidase
VTLMRELGVTAPIPTPQLLRHYPSLLAEVIAPYQQPGDLARICRPVGWFGLNHYSPLYVQPEAFGETLLAIHKRYRLPIYVLENGTANADQINRNGEVVDQPRIDFLNAYTAAVFEAIKAGADVRGYFVWSLLDNFEWGSRYSQRFGIIYVDYPTQRRIPKASFHWHARLIKSSTSATDIVGRAG